MRSPRRRFSDASACFSICARLSPISPPICMPTLVAMSTWSRLPLFASHLPMIVSDSPPTWPGTQVEYVFAVSIRLKPLAAKRSRMAKEVASSAVQPKTLPPSASGAAETPERPRGRLSISFPLRGTAILIASRSPGFDLTEEAMANPFVHVELNTQDLPMAKALYGKLFDWTLEDVDMGPTATYVLIKPGDGTAGGMLKHPMPRQPSIWLAYVLVDDIDAATAKAQSLRAQ